MLGRLGFTLIPLAITMAVMIGCGDDDRPPNAPTPAAVPDTIPSSWSGVWQVRMIARDCSTSAVVIDTTVVDTMCTGEPAVGLFGLDTSDLCPGSLVQIDDPVGRYACTRTIDIGGCSGTLSVDLNASFDPVGGAITGSGHVTFDTAIEIPPCVDVCANVQLIGVRIGSSAAFCPG